MRYLKFVAPVILFVTPPALFAGAALAGADDGYNTPVVTQEAGSAQPQPSCAPATAETAGRDSDNAQIIDDLRTELIKSNYERDRLKRRNFVGTAVALRRSDAIAGLRDYLAGAADSRCAMSAKGEPGSASATNATIAQLQDQLSQARREGQRALAMAVYQRQQHSESSKNVASLQEALAASESKLNEAHSHLETAKLDTSTNDSETSAKIAKLQHGLEMAQRTNQRAIGTSVLLRQRHNDALKQVAALQQDLQASAAELEKARAAQTAGADVSAEISQLTAQNVELQRTLAEAQRDGQRAIAIAVFQRQQRNVAETAAASLRVALAKSGDELRDAQSEMQSTKTAMSTSDAEAHARISTLQQDLETAQRANQRAIGLSVFHRQRHNDALKVMAALRQDLDVSAAELSKARAIQQPATVSTADNTQLTAEIAELQRTLGAARSDGQRAIAIALFQRQQRNIAEKSATSLRVALAKTGDELRNANGDIQNAKTAMSAKDAEASATIAKLQVRLDELQRTSERSIANAVLHRRRWATSVQTEARLQAELEEHHARAAKLSIAFAEVRSELDKTKAQMSHNAVQMLGEPDEQNDNRAPEVSQDEHSAEAPEPTLQLADYGKDEPAVDEELPQEAQQDVPAVTNDNPPVRPSAPVGLSQQKSTRVRDERSKAPRTAALPHRRRGWRQPGMFKTNGRDVIVMTAPVRHHTSRKPGR